MFKFLRSKRGQIRGIDFSLAMIIFLLVMAQILVLTNTFIQSSRSFQSTNSLQQRTSSFARSIATTPGGNATEGDWSSTPTDRLGDWTFGLSNSRGNVDPYKLSRIADNNIADYALNYSFIQNQLDISSNFKIRVTNSINTNITSISEINTTALNVKGIVEKSGFESEQATVSLFVISGSDSSLGEGFDITDQNGLFDSNITVVDSSYYVVVAISKVGNVVEDLTYQIFNPDTITYTNGNLSLQKVDITGSSFGYQTEVITEQAENSTSADFFSLYSAVSVNFSRIQGASETGGIYSQNLNVSQTGMAAFVVIQRGPNDPVISITSFPLLTEGNISKSIGPVEEPNVQSTVSEVSITVRGIILNLQVTTWDD